MPASSRTRCLVRWLVADDDISWLARSHAHVACVTEAVEAEPKIGPGEARSRRPAASRRLRRLGLGIFLSLTVAVAAGGWLGRHQILIGVAKAWIAADEPVPADAVAVFGGGDETRPFAAAAYYWQGLAKKVLISNTRKGPIEEVGIAPSGGEVVRAVLLKLGVAERDIEFFGSDLSSTYAEAVALRRWAEQNGARRVMVPTEIFTTRRLRWVLHRVVVDKVEWIVPTAPSYQYEVRNWWRHEAGVIDFQNEIIKYVYYRLKY